MDQVSPKLGAKMFTEQGRLAWRPDWLLPIPPAEVAPQAPKPAAVASRAPRKGPSASVRFSRFMVRNGRKMSKIAVSASVGIMTAAIIAIAGYVSFDHIRHVGEFAGQASTVAALLPLTADGMILIGGYRLRSAAGNRTRMRIALASMVIGLIASIGGNVLYAIITNATPETLAALRPILTIIFSAWPVIPLVSALEMLTHTRGSQAVIKRAPVKKAGAKPTK